MNLRNRLIPALVVVAVAFCCGTAMAQFGGDANVWLGVKKFSDDLNLEEDSFSIDLTQQTEYGVMLNLGKVDWPIAIAVDILRASDDGSSSYRYDYYGYVYDYDVKLDTSTLEVNVGVRKFFLPDGKIQPYVGAGVDWIQAEADLGLVITPGPVPAKASQSPILDFSTSDTQSAFGYFLNAGVRGKIGKVLNIGFDLRYSAADVEFEFSDIIIPSPSKQAGSVESDELAVGGWHAGIFIGARF